MRTSPLPDLEADLHDLPHAVFDLGGTAVRFESRDRAWLRLLDRRWDAFRSARPPSFVVRQHTTGPTPAALATPLQIVHERSTVEPHGFAAAGFTVTGETFSARVDLAARRAEVAGPRATYPLDGVLCRLLPALVDDGVVLHGATLQLGRRGLVAAGDSGRGKSTLARLLGDAALCDEWTAVRGSAEAPCLRPLPASRARPGRAPLHAILLLEHGRRHALRRLDGRAALRALATVALWPVHLATETERVTERVLARLVTLAERVPVWRFEFLPRADVGAFLESALEDAWTV